MLVSRIDEIDREVEDMLQGWRSVEESGRSLKDACEQLLQERVSTIKMAAQQQHSSVYLQDRILDMTVAIDERLEYFQELEHATRMLNHPGESLVLQTDFLYMVERVDICIDYLKGHVSCAYTLPLHGVNGIHLSDTSEKPRYICYASSNV